ncbi:sensor histidine kinase [Flavobacterium sp. MAH-1]|uniref:Sensor histidine kinase n=1 Tax=Flavobacterium agri TaxID=2743471 RepID=A0A7Y8Y2W2_9FLAO|nr:sensor histidine kinase [Flavobacterium agri]NUY81478.1 sensor histidine kinase [Flavobacterium agri]NYA71502.1 sensor histidine kinase [Flavobacterium agri]
MNTRINSILDSKWWQEIAIFVFMLTIHLLKNDWIEYTSAESVLAGFTYFAMLYAHAQTNRFFLLPILLKQQKPIVYLGLSVGLILLFSGAMHEVSINWLSNFVSYQVSHQKSYVYLIASLSGTLILYLGPTVLLKLYREQKRKQDEALLFNEMQLKSLRSQLNPHFLFNTFNTLYGISLQYPERTSDLIMRMSQMLRYQIESDGRQCVTLEEELEFIASYIELERERLGYRCDIKFDFKTDKENGYKISPMLLITFIENAFKHGTGTIESCFVHLKISVKEGMLKLQLVNSIPEKKNKVVSTKIGLKNTTERLNLLYPHEHMLQIEEKSGRYEVTLELKLKKIATCQPSVSV